jgi:hypothetical protein
MSEDRKSEKRESHKIRMTQREKEKGRLSE